MSSQARLGRREREQPRRRTGFRKIRSPLGVTAFGMNAIVLPAGIETGRHYHERQQEVYFLRRTDRDEFGDGGEQTLEPGGIARVDTSTIRRIRNVGDGDAIYVIVGRRRLRRTRRRRPQRGRRRYQATQ
jgi:uncharacterized cupin superfamily protein